LPHSHAWRDVPLRLRCRYARCLCAGVCAMGRKCNGPLRMARGYQAHQWGVHIGGPCPRRECPWASRRDTLAALGVLVRGDMHGVWVSVAVRLPGGLPL
jgi:hypothetical protein